MKIKPWLSWVAMIPAMLVAQFAAMTIVHLWLMFIMSDSTFRMVLVGVMPNLIGAVAAVMVVQAIAPSHKRVVVFALTALYLIVVGMTISRDLGQSYATWATVYGPAIGAIAGSFGAAYYAVVKDVDLINN